MYLSTFANQLQSSKSAGSSLNIQYDSDSPYSLCAAEIGQALQVVATTNDQDGPIVVATEPNFATRGSRVKFTPARGVYFMLWSMTYQAR